MKKHLPTLLAVLACVLAIACLWQIALLRDELQMARTHLASDIYAVSSNVSNISSSVRSVLEEEAAMLTASSYEIGDVQPDTRTVTLSCHVTPKVYDPAVTTATLMIAGESYPLKTVNDGYAAEIELPLFGTYDSFLLVLEDNGQRRTEQLHWWLDPTNLLPFPWADYHGSWSGQPSDGGQLLRCVASVDVNIGNHPEAVQSVMLIETLDGEEIGRKEILAQEKEGYFYWLELNQDYAIPAGSQLELYAVVEDIYGLYYVAPVFRERVSDDGKLQESERVDTEVHIYDSEGTLLY